jgi:hypothetical protein
MRKLKLPWLMTTLGAALLPLPFFLFPMSPLPVNASPKGNCSGGEIDSKSIGSGVVKLYYDSSTGKNCVKTFANNTSKRKSMNAYVGRSDGTAYQQDPGNYFDYAGPVSIEARGKCIYWGGSIENQYFNSPLKTHCKK